MTTFVFTSHMGDVSTVGAEPGKSAMHAATQNGVVGITGECGGVLSCATCHVSQQRHLTGLEPSG
jgi:2Fe-2S ferredoxin